MISRAINSIKPGCKHTFTPPPPSSRVYKTSLLKQIHYYATSHMPSSSQPTASTLLNINQFKARQFKATTISLND